MKKIFIPIFICLCLIAYVVGYTTTTSTTNLELVKIAEGDLIFDWFDTMNDNLDLIDAIFDTVSLAEFAFLDGVTSNIQDQLDAGGGGTYTAGTGLTLTGTVFSTKDSEIVHDNLSGFVANEHIDWTADQGATNIHAGNYTDTNTTYTGTENEITLTGTTFSLHSDIARDNELHTQNTDTDLDATFEATFFKKADSIGDIGDVDLTDIANLKILKYNSTSGNWECEDESGGGSTTFVALTDTPANYTGQAGLFAKVNAGETALEFGTPGGGGTVTTSGTPVANDIARFTGATIIEGLSYTEFKVALDLEIGTDVQAYSADNAFRTDKLSVFAATTEAELYTVLSDVTLFLEDLVDDTTPDLGGELDAGVHSIGFTLQTATGDGTTTIDWRLGNKFRFTFGSQNDTFTFTAPTNPCTLMLTLIQDGTGSRTATFPATVKWAGGIEPTLTTTAGARDKIALDWDGTQYDGVASLDFK